jgi:hypothetical protein
MIESSHGIIDRQQWSSCLGSNSIDEGMSINPVILTPQSNYSVPSHLPHSYLQYSQKQQQRDRDLEIENPLDHPMIDSLPNQFLKKLHWYLNHFYIIDIILIGGYSILAYKILPAHIYWNTDHISFTIRFETELVHKYLPQLFQFFSISSVIKLLTK